jgi:hypothetical protein
MKKKDERGLSPKKAKKDVKRKTVLSATDETPYILTRQEDALMQVLIDPASRLLPVADICRIAKIGRDTYYRSFGKPEFVMLYRAAVTDLLKRAAAPLVHALLREALRGSAPHLKIALELSGVYDPKMKVEGTVDVDIIQKISEHDFIQWLKEAQIQGIIPNRILADSKKQEALPAPFAEVKSEPVIKAEPVAPSIEVEPSAPVQKIYVPPTPQETYEAKIKGGGQGWQPLPRYRRLR